MKTKLSLLLLAALAGPLAAEILQSDTAVFAQADPKSPVLARIKAGATVNIIAEATPGWRKVQISGPFQAYALARDIDKGLNVRAGGNIYAAPRKDAQILAVAAEGEKSEVTGIVKGANDWVEVRVDKPLQGFIAIGEAANLAPEPTKPTLPAPAPAAPVPPAPTSNLGRPVPMTGNTADLPRLFAGTLVLARRPLINPNPPYDYQLVDSNGRRFAYVDTRRLLLTDKIENFLNLEVSLSGTVRNTVDGKDLVIAAESMTLKK
jgi:hypothetical protein